MRVLVATGVYKPDVGGPATHTALLEEELPSCGFEIVVVPFRKVRPLPRVLRHLYYTWLLIRASRHADLLYALDPVSVGLPTLFAHLITQKPYLLRISGDYAWEQAQALKCTDELPHEFSKRNEGYSLFICLLKKIQTFVARRAAKIITPSKYMKNVVSDWGIDPKDIIVIHNPASKKSGLRSKKEPKRVRSHGGKLVFTAGRLIPLKRFEVLINMVPKILKEFPDTRLVIAGDGPLRKQLSERVETLGLTAHVALPGNFPKQTMLEYMRTADVFVLNSTHETFPHVALEAMGTGTPVVATNVGGNTEIIEDGKSGLLVPSGNTQAFLNAVLSVLRDPAHASRLACGAYERLQLFEKDKIIGRIADVMKSIPKK